MSDGILIPKPDRIPIALYMHVLFYMSFVTVSSHSLSTLTKNNSKLIQFKVKTILLEIYRSSRLEVFCRRHVL